VAEKCIELTKEGKPCKSYGNPATGGMCYPHWKASKGEDINKIRIVALQVYKNGAIGKPVSAGVGIGEIIEVTPVQWKQIQSDNPHAFALR
jgi:hypothetical protein